MYRALYTLLNQKKHFSDLFLQFINFTDQPSKYVETDDQIMQNAWHRTGRHLRKAMTEYEQKQKIYVEIKLKTSAAK